VIRFRVFLGAALAFAALLGSLLHAQLSDEEKKKSEARKAHEEMRAVTSPTPGETPEPKAKPKPATRKSKKKTKPTPKPKPKPTETPEPAKTPRPKKSSDSDADESPTPKQKKKSESKKTGDEDEEVTPKPKRIEKAEPDETPVPKKTPPQKSPKPEAEKSPTPKKKADSEKATPKAKADKTSPAKTPTPAPATPKSSPEPSRPPPPESPAVPRPAVRPTPRPPAPQTSLPSDITVEKSGLEQEQGIQPPPPPPPTKRGFWPFSRQPANYRYLTAANIEAIRRAPVQRARWKFVIVHNSGTRQGSAKVFDYYHRHVRRMKNGLAYHFVIGNGTSTRNGQIEIGDRWVRQARGGHVHSDYMNNIGLGICLVGDFNRDQPTKAQLEACEELIRYLQDRCGKMQVRPHREVNPPRWATDCPGDVFPYGWFGRFR
jgi:hypothetical protein